MNLSAVASLSTQMTQQRVAESAQILVLKKAMDLQASAAQTLIASVAQSSANLPSHLGQNVNVVA